MTAREDRLVARFWSMVQKGSDEECWIWTGGQSRGYGQFGGTTAYRWLYERVNGPVPRPLSLDHLCRNRACVNPKHLEPVSIRENIARGVNFIADHIKATHCPKGHPYSGENLWLDKNGGRHCRACGMESQRAVRDRASKGLKGSRPSMMKDFCKRGHPYSGENLHLVKATGERQCRECNRIRLRAKRALVKASK